MKCFEIDFNNPRWFTAVEIAEDDYELWEVEDLPAVGEEVFVYCADVKSHKKFREDVGFGFVTNVTEVYPSLNTPDCYIIKFENTIHKAIEEGGRHGDVSQD